MNKISPINDNLIKEIEFGKYRDTYLVYNRKSTDEPENQKNSIKYQRSENARFAMRENLKISSISIDGFCVDGVISEKHSAFKEDSKMTIGEDGIVQYTIERPKFFKMIQYLNQGYFKGVIILCWDRISRNKGDETVIRKLMKQGVDFRFVLATYDKTSSGALHMDIDGMFAEHHSRVTSEKVKLNIRNHKEKGICTFKAPVGYLNSGRMEHKPIDEIRAPIVIQLFEKYATGEWSLSALANWAKDVGFTMPAVRRRRTFEEMQIEDGDDFKLDIPQTMRLARATTIQNILRNPFYIGMIYNNEGKLISSKSHVPLISEKLFGIVQAQLLKKKTCIKYSKKIDYPMRGLIRCIYCKTVYTPYLKKGHLYLGHRNSPCDNRVKNIRADSIMAQVIGYLFQISLTENDKIKLNAETDTQLKLLQIRKSEKEENETRRKAKLKEELDYLISNKISLLKNNVYSHEAMRDEETKLRSEILNLQLDELIEDFCYAETIQDVIKLSELLDILIPLTEKATLAENDKIIRLVMSELWVEDNILKFKCKNGFEALERHFNLQGALNCWLSELPSLSKELHFGIKLLTELTPS